MLRVAVPNKGSLTEDASEMLREAGYRQRRDNRELVLQDPENAVEFFFLRPRDIAVYVGAGTLEVGITGRDLLLDSGADAEEVMGLGFGRPGHGGPAGRRCGDGRAPRRRRRRRGRRLDGDHAAHGRPRGVR
jgi:ATP phosphoribosyltransferase